MRVGGVEEPAENKGQCNLILSRVILASNGRWFIIGFPGPSAAAKAVF